MTITLDGDVFKVSGVPNEEVTATEFYSFAVCTCSQEELRGKGYKVTAWVIKGKVNSAWGLRTESENSLAIAVELTPGVNNDIQLRLMVSKDTPTAWEPYENIRPIKGRDSLKVERCGENLFDIAKVTETNTLTKTDRQITLKTGRVHNYDLFVSTVGLTTAVPIDRLDRLPFFPKGTYKISYNTTLPGASLAIVAVAKDGSITVILTNSQAYFTLSYGTLVSIRCAPIEEVTFSNIQITIGSTAPTTYTPYIGQTNTLTLPETVYGGEVDADGEGNNNTKVITLDGNELKFRLYNNIYYDLPEHSAPGISTREIICCSHFERRRVGVNTKYEFCFLSKVDMDNLFASTDELNAYCAAQYAAGTPVQIAYKLAEPVHFTATGAQLIPSLAGANTVLTDADSATVTGRADPIKRITDLEAAVASIN